MHAQTPIEIDQLTLKELFHVLRARAILIIAIGLTFATAGGIAATFAQKWYEASVVLSPVSSTSGMAGSSGSQLGGLAALAGITVGSDSKKSESIAVLQSEALTEQFIEKNNLLVVLFPGEWDAQRQAWKNPATAPTPWKAFQYFKKAVRSVATDAKTGFVTLTIRWNDPRVAAAWANGLVDMTNEILRRKAIGQSERNMAYLKNESLKTDIVEARQAIFTVLRDEINKAMLAGGSDEFAFKILDPARAPERHTSPVRSLWIIIGFVLGSAITAFAVVIRSSW